MMTTKILTSRLYRVSTINNLQLFSSYILDYIFIWLSLKFIMQQIYVVAWIIFWYWFYSSRIINIAYQKLIYVRLLIFFLMQSKKVVIMRAFLNSATHILLIQIKYIIYHLKIFVNTSTIKRHNIFFNVYIKKV